MNVKECPNCGSDERIVIRQVFHGWAGFPHVAVVDCEQCYRRVPFTFRFIEEIHQQAAEVWTGSLDKTVSVDDDLKEFIKLVEQYPSRAWLGNKKDEEVPGNE